MQLAHLQHFTKYVNGRMVTAEESHHDIMKILRVLPKEITFKDNSSLEFTNK